MGRKPCFCAWADTQARSRFSGTTRALHTVSPLATLERGYAIVTVADSGSVVTDAAQAKAGLEIETRLARGRLVARVLRSGDCVLLDRGIQRAAHAVAGGAGERDDAEAQLLASSQQQSFVALRSGSPGKLPAPVADYAATLPPPARAMLDHVGQAGAVGSPATVRERIAAFAKRTGADEIMLCGATFDPEARERSLTLTIEACSSVAA